MENKTTRQVLEKLIQDIEKNHRCKSQTDWDCDLPCKVCNFQRNILDNIKKKIRKTLPNGK